AKLSCLTNLNKLEEALIFVEGLLKDRCENYYVYLEVYLSLLYETNQFEEIMFVLDEEEDIPKELQTKFHELYSMAYQTNKTLINERKIKNGVCKRFININRYFYKCR